MTVAVSWLATYWLHSSIFLALAWFVNQGAKQARSREVLWKAALLGGLLTATVHQVWAPSTTVAELIVAPSKSVTKSAVGPKEEVVFATSMRSQLLSVPTSQPQPKPAAPASFFWLPVAFWVWLGVAGILCLGLLFSWFRLQRRLRHRHFVSKGKLPSVLATMGESPVRLSTTDEICVPVALGIFRPEICVPSRCERELGEKELRAMLAHELAHLRRHDPLWRLGLLVIERLFFFQPLNRLARYELNRVAEILADDWAASRTKEPLALAKCLTTVARWHGHSDPTLAPAMASEPSELRKRVETLIQFDDKPSRRTSPLLPIGVAACLGLVVVFSPYVSFAGEKSADLPMAPSQTKQTASVPKTPKVKVKKRDVDLLSAGDKEELRKTLEQAQAELQKIDKNALQKELEKARAEIKLDMVEVRRDLAQARKDLAEAKDEVRLELMELQKLEGVDGKAIQMAVELGLKAAEAALDDAQIEKTIEEALKAAEVSASAALDSASQGLKSIDVEKVVKSALKAENVQKPHKAKAPKSKVKNKAKAPTQNE